MPFTSNNNNVNKIFSLGFWSHTQSLEQDEQQEIRRNLSGVHSAVGLSRFHLLLPHFPHILQVGGLLRRHLHQGHQH